MFTTKHTYGRKSITAKSKKLHPSVDVTAMVNLSFLLMLFFMLQSFIKKPNHIDLSLPERCDNTCGGFSTGGCGGEWRTLTLLLGENNKVITCFGHPSYPLEEPKVFTAGSKELHNYIASKNNYVLQNVMNPEKEGMTLLIKPTDKCIYKNLIDALDEVSLVKVRTFAVLHQLSMEDKKLVTKNNL